MGAIIKKEFKMYFSSPIGYAIIGVLLIFSCSYYLAPFQGGLADMSYVFSGIVTIVFFVVPVITMRTFSEEKNKRTDQLLLTSPVSIGGIVLGKFFAAILFFAVYVGIMVLYNFAFLFFGAMPHMLTFFGNVLGILLLAGSLIAIGIFISSLTESQIVAAVASFGVSFLLLQLDTIAAIFNNTVVTSICDWISFSGRYATFTEGYFDLSNIIFFLTVIAVFLFLTMRVIDRKRWA